MWVTQDDLMGNDDNKVPGGGDKGESESSGLADILEVAGALEGEDDDFDGGITKSRVDADDGGRVGRPEAPAPPKPDAAAEADELEEVEPEDIEPEDVEPEEIQPEDVEDDDDDAPPLAPIPTDDDDDAPVVPVAVKAKSDDEPDLLALGDSGSSGSGAIVLAPVLASQTTANAKVTPVAPAQEESDHRWMLVALLMLVVGGVAYFLVTRERGPDPSTTVVNTEPVQPETIAEASPVPEP